MVRSSPPDIGHTIKELRTTKNLTLDQLASQSGLSKSMLSQIERNKTNPTVGTLWSLTQALNVEISDLLASGVEIKNPTKNILVTKEHQTPEIQSADGKCTLKILGPLELVSHMEWYEVVFEAGGILDSEPHAKGTKEHLTVLEGQITVSTGEEKDILNKGDTARYSADIHHYIKNHTNKPTKAILIVYTP